MLDFAVNIRYFFKGNLKMEMGCLPYHAALYAVEETLWTMRLLAQPPAPLIPRSTEAAD
jgi:hypothetical protein